MNVNLRGAWSGFWGKINVGEFADVLTVLTWVGVALLVFALLKWVWNKRKGGAQGGDVLYSALIGAIFSAPNFIIPVVLGFIDSIINTLVKLFS